MATAPDSIDSGNLIEDQIREEKPLAPEPLQEQCMRVIRDRSRDSARDVFGSTTMQFQEDGSWRLCFVQEISPEDSKGTLLLSAGIEAVTDTKGKIESVTFRSPCQMGFVSEEASNEENLPPVSLRCEYSPQEDALMVYFIQYPPQKEGKGIVFGWD